jgi:hypothetical protein
MEWVTLCRRTEDPKLTYIEAKLTEMQIPHRRHGESWHAPILEVPASALEAGHALLAMPSVILPPSLVCSQGADGGGLLLTLLCCSGFQ